LAKTKEKLAQFTQEKIKIPNFSLAGQNLSKNIIVAKNSVPGVNP
jgi:hypothetical protein